jgi:4-hydroxy-tetrahydrodipicolinate synthase
MTEVAKSIEGVIVPLLTPLDGDERVDEGAMRVLIQHCLKGGANGVFVGGTSGFGPLMADDQWTRLMEIARDEVDASVPLLGGVIAPSTGRAIDRIRILEKVGFEHMVVTPTFYVTPEFDSEFLDHFDGCCQATDMNMIVYNIPSCTACSIPVSVMGEMVQRGWTKLVKESSGDPAYYKALTEALVDTEASILQGNEPDIASGLASGARGMVPVCGNYAPALFAAAWQASESGDEAALAKVQEDIMATRETLLMGEKSWLAGAMYGVSTLGIGEGRVPRPIRPLTDEQKKEIDRLTESGSDSKVVA